MEESKVKYVKRTQKDYSMSFKLSVVSEIERGDISKTGVTAKCKKTTQQTICYIMTEKQKR